MKKYLLPALEPNNGLAYVKELSEWFYCTATPFSKVANEHFIASQVRISIITNTQKHHNLTFLFNYIYIIAPIET